MTTQTTVTQPHEDDAPHLADVGDGWRHVTSGRTSRGEATTSRWWLTRQAAAAALPAGGDLR